MALGAPHTIDSLPFAERGGDGKPRQQPGIRSSPEAVDVQTQRVSGKCPQLPQGSSGERRPHPALLASACATLEVEARPSAAVIARPAAASRSRSTPVAMPMPSSM